MTETSKGPIIARFGEGETLALPCRPGDHVAWIRGNGLFKDRSAGSVIVDYWETKADRVLITNKLGDLPHWFEITPWETRGAAAVALLPRVQAGTAATERSEGPNIWRVEAGDAIAFIGEPRAGLTAQSGLLLVLDFASNALVLGEPGADELESWMFFGAPTTREPNEFALAGVRAAIQLLRGRPVGSVQVDGWALESA